MRLGTLLALILILALLAPLAGAHVEGARPVLQRAERERTVDVRMEGVTAIVDLSQKADPLRETVRHVLDPARGRFSVEHRPDASAREKAFNVTWEVARLLEYRDLNHDGRFQPDVDTPVKSWRLQNYRWTVSGPADVSVGGVPAKSIIWDGNLSGSPRLRIEVAIAGMDFVDEGARARPQDVMIYFDVRNIPQRSVGSLYAIEGSVTLPPDATLSPALAPTNVTTGALVDLGPRRALLIHGGEALLDGSEQRIPLTLDAPRTPDGGNTAAAMRLHLPITDRAMHFVLVSGVEYELPVERAPGVPFPLVALLLVGVATALRARRG